MFVKLESGRENGGLYQAPSVGGALCSYGLLHVELVQKRCGHESVDD